MAYDPFRRGGFPVGVRSRELRDPSRAGRTLALELWYPAAAGHRGEDLAEATCDRFSIAAGVPAGVQRAVRGVASAAGRFPLVAYFHGATGHRREATELCTHLASHGYVVASPDFSGNTMSDMLHDLAGGQPPRLAPMDRSADDRPLDAKLVLDAVLGGVDPELSARIEPGRVGTCGISFGGWTTLALNSIDRRPRACFPIVPAWGEGPVKTEALSARLRLDDWGRPVPTFVLAAERDALVLLPALRELRRSLPPPRRLAVLRNAGHLHFADHAEQGHEMLRAMWKSEAFPSPDPDIDLAAIAEAARPFAELCPAEHGLATVQGLCLAHLDAYVAERGEARRFLAADVAPAFAARGIDVELGPETA